MRRLVFVEALLDLSEATRCLSLGRKHRAGSLSSCDRLPARFTGRNAAIGVHPQRRAPFPEYGLSQLRSHAIASATSSKEVTL